MNQTFIDISITGLATERTGPSRRAPGLRYMYLTLSAKPPVEWAELLKGVRRFPRHTMWRDAWVEGDAIVVDCVPEEIEKYHLRDLREDVSSANRKYREFLLRREANERREEDAAAKEKGRLEELKGRLRF